MEPTSVLVLELLHKKLGARGLLVQGQVAAPSPKLGDYFWWGVVEREATPVHSTAGLLEDVTLPSMASGDIPPVDTPDKRLRFSLDDTVSKDG